MSPSPRSPGRTARPRPSGRLVAVEGIDGTGKTTLMSQLLRALRSRGWKVARWQEPSDGPLGRAAREASGSDPAQAALLFTLDRGSERARLEKILQKSDLVLSDRSFYSTLAYQGSVLSPRERRGLETLQRVVARRPDLVLWLDLTPARAMERISSRGAVRSPLERLGTLRRVSGAYRWYARSERRRFVRLDASRPPEEVCAAAQKAILARWKAPRRGKAGPRGARL